METVFASDVNSQETHYVVYYDNKYTVFYSVCDAIWFIQNYSSH